MQQPSQVMPVSLFNKLLSRIPAALRPPASPAARADLESQIGRTINDALARAGLIGAADAPKAPLEVIRPVPAARKPAPRPRTPPAAAPSDAPTVLPGNGLPDALAGVFAEHSFSNAAGTRAYKLYVPVGYIPNPTTRYPLLVMLHGCTQSPDDFAKGTRMNALADQHGFLVAYPAQSPNANGSKCWNWFRPGDQSRASGEPALLAGLTQEVISRYAIDPQRVYVAGLSAGAAMAVILGNTYPELYAAVGAHSGLPYRAARDVPSAFAAMGGTHALREVQVQAEARQKQASPSSFTPVPMIVFHGDADHTVAPSNGAALVKQAMAAVNGVLPESRHEEAAVEGRRYTRSVHTSPHGETLVEYWQIHGAGHAWSGGSAAGSYTDPKGPDASAEMVRFFLQNSRQDRVSTPES